MWLSGLHIPESYLTALVQATCRKNGWPLDRSTLYTAVTEVCLSVCLIVSISIVTTRGETIWIITILHIAFQYIAIYCHIAIYD